MIIKKYNEFLKESKFNNRFGEWVESLMDDEFVGDIVNKYINTDPSIRVANSINIMDDDAKREIGNKINKYLRNGIAQKELGISTTVVSESVDSLGGKGVFSSFLKALTSLGGTNMEASFNNTPKDFILFYHLYSVSSNDVLSVFLRFKSLSLYKDLIDTVFDDLSLYYGIKTNGVFEYGVYYDGDYRPFGQFKINAQSIKWLITLDSKSIRHLKKDLVNLDTTDINLLGIIKRDMNLFEPPYYEQKSNPHIQDRVISFGYYGLGKWENGTLDAHDYQNIRDLINRYIMNKKWHSKVLLSVVPDKFWVWVHIKIK